MSTYVATWLCSKCGKWVVIHVDHEILWDERALTVANSARQDPCPCGCDHEWHELTGHWEE